MLKLSIPYWNVTRPKILTAVRIPVRLLFQNFDCSQNFVRILGLVVFQYGIEILIVDSLFFFHNLIMYSLNERVSVIYVFHLQVIDDVRHVVDKQLTALGEIGSEG